MAQTPFATISCGSAVQHAVQQAYDKSQEIVVECH